MWGTPIISPDNQGVRVDVRQPTRSAALRQILARRLTSGTRRVVSCGNCNPAAIGDSSVRNKVNRCPRRQAYLRGAAGERDHVWADAFVAQAQCRTQPSQAPLIARGGGIFLVVEVLLRPDFQDSSIEAKRLELVW